MDESYGTYVDDPDGENHDYDETDDDTDDHTNDDHDHKQGSYIAVDAAPACWSVEHA